MTEIAIVIGAALVVFGAAYFLAERLVTRKRRNGHD